MDAVLNDALKEQKKIDSLCDKLEKQKGARVDQPGPYMTTNLPRLRSIKSLRQRQDNVLKLHDDLVDAKIDFDGQSTDEPGSQA